MVEMFVTILFQVKSRVVPYKHKYIVFIFL